MTDGQDEADAEIGTVVLAGWRTGKSQRQIAVDLFGAARVDAEWSADSQLRAKVRRLVDRARAGSDVGASSASPGTP